MREGRYWQPFAPVLAAGRRHITKFLPRQNVARRVGTGSRSQIKRSEERVKTRAIRTVIMIALSATALAFTGCASERYRYHDNYYDGSAHQAHAYGVRNGYSAHGWGPLNHFRTAIERGTAAASVRDMKRRIAGGEIATMMGTDIDDEAGLSFPEEIPLPRAAPKCMKTVSGRSNFLLRA
jgi:hypothetical protein